MGLMAIVGWIRTRLSALTAGGVTRRLKGGGQYLLEKVVNYFFPTNSSGNNMSRG